MNKLRPLNIIAPRGPHQFADLLIDSFARKGGVKIHSWDYRRQNTPWWEALDQTAPTIVMRGNEFNVLPHVLEWLKGPRYLWYCEDIAHDRGTEIMKLACFYDDIWLHWLHPDVLHAIQAHFSRKRIRHMPILYADKTVWTPGTGGAHWCEVLHYGELTPRREALLAGLKCEQMVTQKFDTLVIHEVQDKDHRRLAKYVQRSKSIINLHAWSPVNVEKRIAEAMMCGALVVTEALPVNGIPGELADPDSGLLWHVPAGNTGAMADAFELLCMGDWWKYWEECAPKIRAYAEREFSHEKMADDVASRIWD